MRRLYVRGSENVLKRVLVQAAAFNIGLLLRKLTGWGKPRQGTGRLGSQFGTSMLAMLLAELHQGSDGWLQSLWAHVEKGMRPRNWFPAAA